MCIRDRAREGSCDPQRVVSEIQILSKLQHPNIVRMLSARISHDRKLHVVMELCNHGELFDHIIEREHYTEPDAVQVMRQVLLAVSHLHAHGIIHRDIKPENVLVHQLPDRLVFKLSDFGLAKHMHGNSTAVCSSPAPVSSRNTVCGTPTYSAPEVWTGVYSHVADCFSTGVLMFVLLSGHFPAFIRQAPMLPGEDWDCVSGTAKELLLLLLLHNPQKRVTAQQALEHGWFNQAVPPTPLPSAQQQLRSGRGPRHSPVFTVERQEVPVLAPPPKRTKRTVAVGGGAPK
eukprot:TRINITY_DN44718_c0_g1_i1.p1 TRINITY_DN44718_c0_g1~~TRINITY_DN44718_c0_g1_i1.p1  ORF type:complete len:288 (-),score=60.26 TRINITY_DN44718_c0_g1_i1:26-889(-)